MRLTILGSGTAGPTARRASAGHLVEWDGGACLLDASAGTYMRALQAGLNPAALRAVLITHFHPDHTGDLAGLLWARRNTPDLAAELRLVGPPGTADLLARFRAVYGDWLAEGAPCRVDRYPAAFDGLAVEAFPARHSPEAVCLRVTADGKVLAYSGDTGDCEGLRAACAGADLALIECTEPQPQEGHLTPAECEAVVAASNPRQVLLTHIGPGIETTLPVAEDGMAITL